MPYIVIDPTAAAAAPAITLGAPKTSVGKTLLEMRTRLKLQLAGRDDITDPRVDEWINDAYVDICSSIKLPELLVSFAISTVADQPLYTLPDNVEYIRDVSVIDEDTYALTGGRLLSKTTLEAFRREPDESGDVAAYFREGEVLVVYPTPEAVVALSVDAKIIPQPLVDETDSPIIGRQFHEILLKAAKAKAHSDLMEADLAAIAENEWVSLLRRKESPMAEEETGRVVGSSVPTSSHHLIRQRRGRRN